MYLLWFLYFGGFPFDQWCFHIGRTLYSFHIQAHVQWQQNQIICSLFVIEFTWILQVALTRRSSLTHSPGPMGFDREKNTDPRLSESAKFKSMIKVNEADSMSVGSVGSATPSSGEHTSRKVHQFLTSPVWYTVLLPMFACCLSLLYLLMWLYQQNGSEYKISYFIKNS